MRPLAALLPLVALWTTPAGAHSSPQATGILRDDAAGAEAAQWVRTNRGLILSSDRGSTPRFLCSEAYGALIGEDPPMLLAPPALIVASYDEGLMRVAADGCSREVLDAPLAGRHVVDLAAVSEGTRYLALLAPTQTQPGAMLVSEDGGTTWTEGSPMAAFGTAMRVAPSDESRVYITAQLATEDGVPVHQVLVSDDGAATYATHTLELFASEVRAFVLGVDPLDEARVFLRTLPGNPETPERLLLSEDGGQLFSEVHASVGPLALAIDDSTVWVGGRDGLFRSDDRGRYFEPVLGAPGYIGCVVLRGDSLSICGYAGNEFGVFTSALGSPLSFESEVRFTDVTEQVSCGADSDVYSSCQADFQHWIDEVARPSAGGAAGSGGGNQQEAAARSDGDSTARGGCRMARSGGRSSSGAALAWLLTYALRRLAGGRKAASRGASPSHA